MASVLAWLAGTSLVRQTHYVDLHRAAWRLEHGQSLGLPVVERRSSDVQRLVATRECDDTSLRAGVTLSLASIDRRNPAVDFDAWSAAVDRGRQLLRAAIACSPHRGAFWARLAAVERLIAASPGRVMPLAAMSVRLSPAELGVIRTRFQLWRTAASWLPEPMDGPLMVDLRTILQEAQLTDIKQMVGRSRMLREAALRAMPEMSGDRRKELARLRFDEDLRRQPPQGAQFDMLNAPRP